MGCRLKKTVDYERSILTCTKCGVFEYCPVYVSSYNHMMQPSRRKCIYKRYNFKVILNQFFCSGKRVVPDDVMVAIKGEIHDETNILYNYNIPITIPILECILKRNQLTMYKGSLYCIYFKLSTFLSLARLFCIIYIKKIFTKKCPNFKNKTLRI